MKYLQNILLVTAAFLLASCGVKKAVVTEGSSTISTSTSTDELAKRKLNFVQKVSDNALYQQNIVSKINFTLQTNSKNITVPGSIHMRKDDVIRIQLMVPLLGTEVGRLEFTKDYVLIVDRMHKQYIQGDYNKVDFLRDKGLNFYSLQALFWNQLFLPGAQRLGESQLSNFDVDLSTDGVYNPVTLKQGAMSFCWSADKASALIKAADIIYNSSSTGTTTLKWNYDDFRALGSKQYPNTQIINFKTGATKQQRDVTVTLQMNSISTDSNWETRTTVSSKYKQVSVEDVLQQLMNL
ncbi:MAG: DUF4292 domain-containing protein [Prevotella sp.]|nr:DUF4292 domain-containing protein [Prevotella sp.]